MRAIIRVVIYLSILIVSISGCSSSGDGSDSGAESPHNGSSDAVEVRNSATVSVVYSGTELESWLRSPRKAFVQGYFKFPPDLAKDILMGFDVEFLEGADNPIRFDGADWMALVGINRDGQFFIPVGTDESLSGVPSGVSKVEQPFLGASLKPDTWYRLRIEADFNSLQFISVVVEGGGLTKQIDLSGFRVDYPNYIPFDRRALTFYFFALRARELAGTNGGSTQVYFDDVEGGIETDSGELRIFSNGCEEARDFVDPPITLPVTSLADFDEGIWYKENEGALLSYTSANVRSGSRACIADARL